jgi:hypothetical protein
VDGLRNVRINNKELLANLSTSECDRIQQVLISTKSDAFKVAIGWASHQSFRQFVTKSGDVAPLAEVLSIDTVN